MSNITLRDHFAGLAMQGLLASPTMGDAALHVSASEWLKDITETAYDFANTMVEYMQLMGEAEELLAQPVAWKDRTYGNLHHVDYGNSIPLYTAPPKREPLSDDDVFNIGYKAGFAIDQDESADYESEAYGFLNGDGYVDNEPYFKLVRAIEKAHGIGGEE